MSTPRGPRFAAVQTCSTENVEENLKRCEALVLAAADQGADWVGLPENFAYLGSSRDHKLGIAEPLDAATAGPILDAMQKLALQAKVFLLLGGFPEQVNATDGTVRIGNTSVLLGADGRILARYRKIHLFDVEVPGGQKFRESDDVVPGADPVLATLPWGPIGLSICYDLRFPELYRHYAAAGARFISVPAAFTKQTGPDHWHVLLRARAIENQAFVIAPAQWGQHGEKRASYGHAVIVDPWGTVISDCSEGEGFALATLDLEFQDRVRQRLPCLEHRRLK
jgi:deaminated glutathione amidase